MDEGRLRDISHRHGIRLLVQFGSSVDGPVHARSDLDLGVLLACPAPTLRQLGEIHVALQSLVADRQVDVAILNRADPLFLKKVTERCRLLAGSPRDLHELRMYAFRRYQDHRRYLDLERAYVVGRLARPGGA
jgi:uncharacterized protein